MTEPLPAGTNGAGAGRLQAGVWQENPVLVQTLGMCPTLAVTNTAANALAMGLATATVLLASALVISPLRGVIPAQVRLASFVLIIASFVTIVDRLVEALDLELHRALGAFLPLIVVNCLILGRMEAFASRHAPRAAVMDALGMGAGFVLALLGLGAMRELLGQGTLFGSMVFGARYEPWAVMMAPGGGFFALAGLMLGFQAIRRRARGSAPA